MSDLRIFSDNLIIPIGVSAAGKGEVTGFLKQQAEETGYELMEISSGWCFRKTRDKLLATPEKDLTPDEINTKRILEATMLQGKFVPTLDGIKDPLQDVFEIYIEKTLNGKKVRLVLDGFLRMGKYEYKNEELGIKEPIEVPAQIEQVSEVFFKALRKVVLKDGNRELAKKLDPELLASIVVNGDESLFDVKKQGLLDEISRDVLMWAKYPIIDIPPEDAESMMRFRAIKSLKPILKELQHAAEGTGFARVNAAGEKLNKALQIMEGKFELGEEGEVIPVPDMETNLIPTPFDENRGKASDRALEEVTKEIYDLYGMNFVPEKSNLKLALGAVNKDLRAKTEFGLGLDELREDDLSYKKRESRIGEFEERTLPEIVRDRIGVGLVYEGDKAVGIKTDDVRFNRNNLELIVNGPCTRDVSYSSLKDQSRRAGKNMFPAVSKLETEAANPSLTERRRV